MATIADVHYLFVGLGDGHVVSFPLEVAAESGLVLGTPKKVALGTQPVGLACFRNNGMVCVFVASDRPAVIYCSGGKLLYANVNMGEVCNCCNHFPVLSGLANRVWLPSVEAGVDSAKFIHSKSQLLAEVRRSKSVLRRKCQMFLSCLLAGQLRMFVRF